MNLLLLQLRVSQILQSILYLEIQILKIQKSNHHYLKNKNKIVKNDIIFLLIDMCTVNIYNNIIIFSV